MAGHKRGPQMAGQSPRQRLVELGKDILIVILTCSAIYLAGLTPMMTQLRSWMTPPVPSAQVQPRQARDTVIPCGVAVRNGLGLYGVSYDEASVERAFSLLSPLLGQALTTAGEVESITPRQWQQLLEGEGIYCQFQGSPPLEALSAWLGEGSSLTGSVQAVALGWDGSAAWLGWQDGDASYRARTQVSYSEHMRAVLDEFRPNGAAFVYTLRESDETYDVLDPYVLVAMESQRPMTYAAVSPDFIGDSGAMDTLLGAMGFRSGVGSAYEAAGERAINENGDRLRVNAAGRVVFHTGEENRYPVNAAGESATSVEAALAAWEILDRAAAPWKGEEVFILTGAEKTELGWRVSFQSRLHGIPVYTGKEGWCAQFTIEGRKITDFTLDLRSYTSTGETCLVTSERLAAAALRSQAAGGQKLKLCYTDNGTPTVAAVWMAEE